LDIRERKRREVGTKLYNLAEVIHILYCPPNIIKVDI